MTNQEKKAELKKYGDLNKDINRKLSEFERIKAMCTRMTTAFSDMPKAPGMKSREDLYIKLADMADEINADVDRYVDMRRDIERKIQSVDDTVLRTLLSYRYIDGCTWEQTAVNMNYCYMQVCRLHGKALNEIML